MKMAPPKHGLLLFGMLLVGVQVVNSQRNAAPVTTPMPKKKHLQVTSLVIEPFLMKKKGKQGNDQYEGFIKDLLEEVTKKAGLTYTLNVRSNNTWAGLVQDVANKNYDMAAAPLTISRRRENLVDMTKPYMVEGISLLMNKKDAISVRAPSIDTGFVLKPFKPVIWVCILLAMIATIGCFYLISRFDPNEIKKDKKTGKETQFGFISILWMVMGSLLLQGYTKRPQSAAAFVLIHVWWVFCLVVFAFYIAGLTHVGVFDNALIKVANFKSVEDVSEQTQIKYGAISGGTTLNFFKESRIALYERMYNFMQSYPSGMVPSVKDGIDMVKKGGYAMFAETPMIDYWTARDCELVQVGQPLNRAGYGFALQKGSPLEDDINQAIMMLLEGQYLQEMYNKWWKNDGACPKLNEPDENEGKKAPPSSPLSMGSIGGMFIIFLVGVLLAMLIMCVEIFLHNRKEKEKSDSKSKSDAKEEPEEVA